MYWSAAGQRIFNVSIQGNQVLTNFDIPAAAGGKNLPVSRVASPTTSTTASFSCLSSRPSWTTPAFQEFKCARSPMSSATAMVSRTGGGWLTMVMRSASRATARAPDDADRDGASNQHEYLASADPLNAASVFKITSAEVLGTEIQVKCQSVTNRMYQLQRHSTLVLPAWDDIERRWPARAMCLCCPTSAARSMPSSIASGRIEE